MVARALRRARVDERRPRRQKPGDLEKMQGEACKDFRGVHLVAGAGHWVQQEQPEKTSRLLVDFLAAA